MSPKIEIDVSEPPEIDVLVEQLPWTEVENYVRVAQRFHLVEVPDSGEHRGIYRAGTGVAATDDLGTNREDAVKQFRDILRRPADTSALYC